MFIYLYRYLYMSSYAYINTCMCIYTLSKRKGSQPGRGQHNGSLQRRDDAPPSCCLLGALAGSNPQSCFFKMQFV